LHPIDPAKGCTPRRAAAAGGGRRGATQARSDRPGLLRIIAPSFNG
jgi:hypothetical protein